MGISVNAELPILVLFVGLVCALVVWLVATFTTFLRDHRYRVSLAILAFPLCGLMGLISSVHAAGFFSDWLAGKPPGLLIAIAYGGYLLFGFLGCWTAVRLSGRLDRKHTLSVLYNLVREHKKRDMN